jgi:heme oxygenase
MNGGEYAKAMDAIHTFIADCKARNVDYVDAFLTGNTTAEEYAKVCLVRHFTKTEMVITKLRGFCLSSCISRAGK